MAQVEWQDPSSKSTVVVTKVTGETVIVTIGNFIYCVAYPNGIRVNTFIWNPDTSGPIGLTFSPWIPSDQRWGATDWDTNGGSKVDWNTVELINNGVCPDANMAPPVVPDTTVVLDAQS